MKYREDTTISNFEKDCGKVRLNWPILGLAAVLTFSLWLGCDAGSTGSQNIAWIENFNAALDRAKAENKPVLVDFFATWCGPCKLMDRETYSDSAVAAELTNWISARIDVDRNVEVAKRFGIDAIPTTVLLQSDGKEIARESGYVGPKDFLTFAKKGRQNPPVSK